MNKFERVRLLSIFADAKEHSCFEVINFGSILLKKSQRQTEKIFKRLLEYGWVKRCGKSGLFHTDFYLLSRRGDDAYRQMQIDIISLSKIDSNTYRHFKYFDRNKKSKDLEDRISEKELYGSAFIPKFGVAEEKA